MGPSRMEIGFFRSLDAAFLQRIQLRFSYYTEYVHTIGYLYG